MLDDAAEELRAIDSTHRKHERVLFLKYQLFAAMGKWKAANLATKSLIKAHPDRPMYWLAGAACARQLGSMDAAEAILESARALHPENGPIWYALAVCATVGGRIEEARRWVSQAIHHEPRLHQRFMDDAAMRPLWNEPVR